jgi:hypothetical protein
MEILSLIYLLSQALCSMHRSSSSLPDPLLSSPLHFHGIVVGIIDTLSRTPTRFSMPFWQSMVHVPWTFFRSPRNVDCVLVKEWQTH